MLVAVPQEMTLEARERTEMPDELGRTREAGESSM